MNYNYINGLIVLDSYYTSISFKLSSSFSIIKNPNLRSIIVNFTEGMMSSDINQFELIEDILLVEDFKLLDNSYVILNNNIYYCKTNFKYMSQFITDFLDNNIVVNQDHIIINIKNDISVDDYKLLLKDYFIIKENTTLNYYNFSLIEINKKEYILTDNKIYSNKKSIAVSSVDVRLAFIDAIENLTGIKVVTSIDQREFKDIKQLEYFQLSNGIAIPESKLNTRIIFDENHGRIKNNTIYFNLNYFTKDISLYERRVHEMLLKNDLNRLVSFKIFNNWGVSVDWNYDKLPDDIQFDNLKLDDNSDKTMMYSISFNVMLLFFIVESNLDYPKILQWIVNLNTKDSTNVITSE